MNKYETIILISNKITEEQKNSVINKITKLISENGKVTGTEDIGERKLAYEVKNHNKAFYYVINFESNTEFIAELERNYRIIDEIIKFIIVKHDEMKGKDYE